MRNRIIYTRKANLFCLPGINRLWLSFIFILIFHPLFSQQYSFVNYSINQGLPGSGISDIFQDSKGILWVGTQSGLASYNGNVWQHFPYKNELSYADISTIFEDRYKNIWVGTKDKGLFVFNGKITYRFTEKNGINSLFIKSICEDNDGHLLIAVENMPLLQITAKANTVWEKIRFEIYQDDNKMPINTVNYLFKDRDKNVWMGTDKGILVYNGISYEKFTLFNGLPHNKINGIFEDSSNKMWFSTPRGVVCYDYNKFTVYNTNNGLISNKVSSISQDTEGNLWFGTNKGISIFKNELFYTVTDKHGLSDNNIKVLSTDGSGNLWIGTSFGGLDKYSGRAIQNFSVKEGLKSNHIYAIALDTANNIYIGTHRGLHVLKISEYENYQITRYSKNLLPSDTINTIYIDSENRKWIGTNKGLSVLSKNKFQKLQGIHAFNITAIYQKDNIVWIGGTKNLYKITFSDFSKLEISLIELFTNKNGLPNGIVSAIYGDAEKQIWIAYEKNGLVLYDGRYFNPFIYASEIRNITCLNGDENATWIGTESNGIFRLKFEGFPPKVVIANFRAEDGLSSNRIKSLNFIDQNNCVVGTNKGFDKLIFNNDAALIKVKRISESGTYKLIETTERASCYDKDGKIYIGSLQGLFIYDPDKENFDINPPNTHITKVQLYFKDVDWFKSKYSSGATKWFSLPKKLNLPANQNHLSFDFIGINLKAQQQVVYQWKLSPVDKEWSPPVKKNSVTFSDLSPGSYTFNVRSLNVDGTTDLEAAAIKFTIHPPFYQSTWFVGSAIVLLALGIYFILRLRTQKLDRARKLLEKQVAVRTYQLREEKEKVENQNKRIIQQANELADQRDQMLHINEMLENQNRDTIDSINYAKTIQKALLGPTEAIVEIIDKSFAFYKPKDIVSGDFYWFSKQNNVAFIAAVDCTGHGVPGAFMSIIGLSLIKEILLHDYSKTAAEILTRLDEGVGEALNLHKKNTYSKDGMDMALCKINFKENTLNFSGAKRPLYYLKKESAEIEVYKGERIGIGEKKVNYSNSEFKDHFFNINKGDRFYIFSDGFIDQFGGEKNKKILGKQFRSLLLSLKDIPMIDQEDILSDTIEEWQGMNTEQTDDILVIGAEF